MRIIMMGTGPFAVPTFEALLSGPNQVVALVTRPAVNVRGTESSNPMRDVAHRAQITVLEPVSINDEDAQQALARLSPELFVVCDYGQILKPAALAIAPLGGINLH